MASKLYLTKPNRLDIKKIILHLFHMEKNITFMGGGGQASITKYYEGGGGSKSSIFVLRNM